ncbi:hypothetical protein AAFG07_31830 [Bradyrhizobium sp. B097]|uniref:hypothetical protein n=1 Tax=Bradyrhizobium sp. B097 TaxID=3140244 RepID=UPI0031843D89
MPKISGEWPNGSPVHRIQGASKMHKTQVDLVPIGRARDEVSRIDGQPSDCTASIAILDEAEPLGGADRLWAIRSPRRHVPAYLGRGIGRNDARNLYDHLAPSDGVIQIDLLGRGAGEESRALMPHVSAYQY